MRQLYETERNAYLAVRDSQMPNGYSNGYNNDYKNGYNDYNNDYNNDHTNVARLMSTHTCVTTTMSG